MMNDLRLAYGSSLKWPECRRVDVYEIVYSRERIGQFNARPSPDAYQADRQARATQPAHDRLGGPTGVHPLIYARGPGSHKYRHHASGLTPAAPNTCAAGEDH